MPDKVQVHYDSLLKETLEAMTSMGLLLVAQGQRESPTPWRSAGADRLHLEPADLHRPRPAQPLHV